MIAHELILLGLLKESPKHGYEIKKEVREIFALFAGIDLSSIYYPLRVLEKKGFIAKTTVKTGRRPARYVYELTPKGQSRFTALLTKSFLDFKRPQFSIDLSLYFFNYLKPGMAKRRLKARMFLLRKLSAGLGQMAKAIETKRPGSLARILNHNRQMVEAEVLFLENLTKTL
jgi:DNA-binding PadR family transcriptional regulator